MLYDIRIYSLGVPDEISFADWVKDIDKVPYLTRNLDRSLIAEGYGFKLSNRCPIDIEQGARILFYRGDDLVHIGLVEKKTLDEDTLLYDVQVKHILTELKNKTTKDSIRLDVYANPQTFVNKLLSVAVTKTVGGNDQTLISYKKLVEAIIDECQFLAIGLDWTNANVFTEPSFQWMGSLVGTGSIGLISSSDTDDVYFLPEQINCIGQSGIYSPNNITDDMDLSRPNLFDLLSILCQTIGLNFVPKDNHTFYAVCKTESGANISNDDDLFSIAEEELEAESIGISSEYRTLLLEAWFTLNYNPWTSGVQYKITDVVSDGGNLYICLWLHTSNSGNRPPNTAFWGYLKPVPAGYVDYYVDDNPDYNGNNGAFWATYNSIDGLRAQRVDWNDNFNPIIWKDSSTVYIVAPQVDVATTVVKYQREAILNTFIKQTIITKASYVFDSYYLNNDSIYIDDINNDAVEMEYVL